MGVQVVIPREPFREIVDVISPKSIMAAPTDRSLHYQGKLEAQALLIYHFAICSVWPDPLFIFLPLGLTVKH